MNLRIIYSEIELYLGIVQNCDTIQPCALMLCCNFPSGLHLMSEVRTAVNMIFQMVALIMQDVRW